MSHEVFINYSAADAPLAEAVCAGLEARGLRCWLPSRDVPAASERAAAITDAIRGARVMVLISPADASSSRQLKRDIARAVAGDVSLITVRAEELRARSTLEHAIGPEQSANAVLPSIEPQLDRLADAIRALLVQPTRHSGSGAIRRAAIPPVTPAGRRNLATVTQFPVRRGRAPLPRRSLETTPSGGFRQARFGLLVLALVSLGYIAISIGRSRPPHILSVQFPTTIYAGQETTGRIAFEDARKSVASAHFEVVESTSFPAFTVTTPDAAGRTSGTISFSINAPLPQHVVLQTVLVDSAGRQSNRVPFAFDVRTPPGSRSQEGRPPRAWSIELPRGSNSPARQ